MPRVLLIDDEPIYYKMLVHTLKPIGYEVEYTKTGMEGLTAVPLMKPDVIITDVRLPDLSGYEVAQRLRRDPRYNNIPIIFLTSQADLSNKLKAFEVGADDYLSKPFQPEELVARLGVLVRRSEALKAVRHHDEDAPDTASILAVHSLRGGVGCSTLAVNLAIAFYQIWQRPTLIIDSVLNAGQVALMMNVSPRYTWADLSEYKSFELDQDLVASIITRHPSGVELIASPTYPVAGDTFSEDFWQTSLQHLKTMYEFIIIDTAHDFNNISIQMLDPADHILMPLVPEMASIRAAVCALNIYEKLGYGREKIIPIINNAFFQAGIKQPQIEKALSRPVEHILPNTQAEFTKAINFGEPYILTNNETPASFMIEDMAYKLSKEVLKNIPPAAPTLNWRRVNNRLTSKR